VGLTLGVAGWLVRRERQNLAYGLLALGVLALALGSAVLAAGSGVVVGG
jgi:hypothetical protein